MICSFGYQLRNLLAIEGVATGLEIYALVIHWYPVDSGTARAMDMLSPAPLIPFNGLIV
jgi:hypothetical protein